MKKDSQLSHLGLAPENFEGVVNMPVSRASTILFKSLADFDAGERGESPHPTYGRYGTPSSTSLEKAIAILEGADHAIVFSSGLAAIIASIQAFIKTGDHILVPDTVYGPARRHCDYELKKFGVEVEYYDPAIGTGIEKLMKPNTRIVYLESPGSLTFEMQGVPAIAAVAHKHGAIVIADNTWATPLYFKPFEHGVDISVHSATKYISGHSDLVMGAASCKEEHYKQLLRTARNLGGCASADSCYLALRGLRTMAVRMKYQQESAIKVAKWLQSRKDVLGVDYPVLPNDAGHALWKRDMTGGASLFAFRIKNPPREKLAKFMDDLEFFGMGYSWGGFESLLIPCKLDKVRTATKYDENTLVLRIHIGLEDADDLIADLEQGFARLHA